MTTYNSTSAIIRNSEKKFAQYKLTSDFSAGPLDFWKIESNNFVALDERFGKNNLLENSYLTSPYAVTFGDDATPFADAPKKESFAKKLRKDVVVNWSEADGEVMVAAGMVIGFLEIIAILVILFSQFSWLYLTASLAVASLLMFISIMISGRYESIYDDSLRGNKRWDFPVDEHFIVLKNSTAQVTRTLLNQVKNNPLMCERVRTKLQVDRNHDSVDEWVSVTSQIFSIDRDFPYDCVPLMNDDTKKVLTALKVKAGVAPVPAIEAPEPIAELSEIVNSPFELLPTRELRAKMEVAKFNSQGDLFNGLAYIENM